MDEQAIIAAAKKGDVQAFNRLVYEYQSLAYNVAYRILGDRDSAADACQDAFLSAFKNIRQFRGGSFKAWLLRIATNACYDQLRLKKRRPADSLDDILEDPDHSLMMSDPGPLPESHALRRELEEAVMSGLQSLPEDQRVTLILTDIQGLELPGGGRHHPVLRGHSEIAAESRPGQAPRLPVVLRGTFARSLPS